MKNAIPEKLASPNLDAALWIAPNATVIGDVTIKPGANIWYNCVLRADINRAPIIIGEDTNIQDGAVVHVDFDCPANIGKGVTVGHNATVHGATILDGALIGMGATVLSGAVVGAGAIVAAGALVREGQQIEPQTLYAGVPAKRLRELTPDETEHLDESWQIYKELARLHAK